MKVWIFSMCFNRPEVIRDSLAQLRATTTAGGQIVMLDQHYPLPSSHENTLALLDIAREHGALYLNAGRNLGLARGFNHMLHTVGVEPEDVVIGYDPDCYPETVGWDSAFVDVLRAAPDVGWASLGNDFSEREMKERGFTPGWDGGHFTWTTHKAVLNSVCAWPAKWMLKVGGLTEPNKYYGGVECCMWDKLQPLRWVFLTDFREIRRSAIQEAPDTQYTAYKWAHAHEGFPGDFRAFLVPGAYAAFRAEKGLPPILPA